MSATQLWYVRTTFGALLGPMPDDTLKIMARSGDLIPEDFVRHGLDGEWIEAAVFSKLFETRRMNSTGTLDVSVQKEDEVSEKQVTATTRANSITTAPIEIEAAPLPTGETAHSSFPTISDQPRPFVSTKPFTHNPHAEPQPKAARTHRHQSVPPSVTNQTKFDLKRLRSSRTMAALVLCAIAIVWWSWSRTNRGVYDRLFAIRTELIEHRIVPDKQSDLATFASKALAQLDSQIPSLQSKANWGNREANYLLLASRDCLKPMLQSARHPQEQLEENLDYFLWALRSYYEGQPLGAPNPPRANEALRK